MSTLIGPRSAPAAGAPDALVMLLHGYGANGDDLIALADVWRPLSPQALFVAPNAPEPVPMTFNGLQWFAIARRDAAEYRQGVARAAPLLQATIDAELAQAKLAPSRLVLVGFSQGTMMGLHVGLRRAVAPAAILGYSGRLADGDTLRAEMTAKPPIQLIHGDQDDLIPVAQMHAAAKALTDAGLQVATHVSRGVGHGIGEDGLRLGGAFIAASLKASAG